jgi:hypothetical protein
MSFQVLAAERNSLKALPMVEVRIDLALGGLQIV